MSITRRIHRTPLALLLWAAALLFGQSAGLAHQHLDDTAGTSCVVCTLSQAQTAACDSAAASAPPVIPFLPTAVADVTRVEASPARHFQSRAPPRA